MRLFPISTPTFALSVSEDALCLVEIKKQWRKTFLRQVTRVPLRPGVVKLSSVKPNIEHVDEFLTSLQSLVRPFSRPLPLALSLPDLCARTSVFDFSTFPSKTQEQTALVRWRFQQDLKLDTSQSRLNYGLYIPSSVTNASSLETVGQVRVLGTAIRHDIVEQYERMCLEAQMIPTSVSLAGLDIFDLYRTDIQERLEAEHTNQAFVSARVMFAFISHWGFTFLGFQDGSPRFIRTKAIAVKAEMPSDLPGAPSAEMDNLKNGSDQTGTQCVEAASQHHHDSDTLHPLYPSYTTMKVGKELLATLQYYVETFPASESTSPDIHLFVATDVAEGHSLVPPIDQIQSTLKASGGPDIHIRVTALSHASHFHLMDSRFSQPSQEESALPGYASLLVA